MGTIIKQICQYCNGTGYIMRPELGHRVYEKCFNCNYHIRQMEKIKYSDGKDYSHLEINSEKFPGHEECVNCGSDNVTITDEADICHDCGYVYT